MQGILSRLLPLADFEYVVWEGHGQKENPDLHKAVIRLGSLMYCPQHCPCLSKCVTPSQFQHANLISEVQISHTDPFSCYLSTEVRWIQYFQHLALYIVFLELCSWTILSYNLRYFSRWELMEPLMPLLQPTGALYTSPF
jgi:hypothetical protein